MEVSILIIRQERPEDYDTVYHVVKEAFENAEYTDGNEQNLVAALRKSKSFIPELSLVAVIFFLQKQLFKGLRFLRLPLFLYYPIIRTGESDYL